jgi:hypothetical protein
MSRDAREAIVTAHMGEHHASSKGLRVAERTGDLLVPYRDTQGVEGIALGFRVHMFDLGEPDGMHGQMATGSGFGSDFICFDWTTAKGAHHDAYVRGLDIMRAWVSGFAPEEAKNFPDGLK